MEGEQDQADDTAPHTPPSSSTSEDPQRSFRADGQNNAREETMEAAPSPGNSQHPADAAAQLTHPFPSLRSGFLLIHRYRGASAAWCRGARHPGFLGPDAADTQAARAVEGDMMRPLQTEEDSNSVYSSGTGIKTMVLVFKCIKKKRGDFTAKQRVIEKKYNHVAS